MNIYNPFKERSLCVEDSKHHITDRMQDLPKNMTIAEVNAMKLASAKEYLGDKYILHPVNAIRRKGTV